MKSNALRRAVRFVVHRVLVAAGGISLTLLFFLVLPLMQSLSSKPNSDLIVQTINTAEIPPPPPPPEEEQKPDEEKPQEQPIDLAEEAQPLDLAQLELALNPGVSGSFLSGDFAVKLSAATSAEGSSDSVDALFALADLDQKPRVLYQPSPTLNAEVRKHAPGTVHIIFIVDERGRVQNPIVQKSTDPIFEAPALAAIQQWKFESGKRNGESVRFRMQVPITFPKGQ